MFGKFDGDSLKFSGSIQLLSDPVLVLFPLRGLITNRAIYISRISISFDDNKSNQN